MPAVSNMGYLNDVEPVITGRAGTPGPGVYAPPPGMGFGLPAASNMGTRVGFVSVIGLAFGIIDGWLGTSGYLNCVTPLGAGFAGTPGPGVYV